MVSERVAVLVKVSDVPLMVTVDVPVVAAALAVSVNVLVLVVLFGLNEAVTPLGKPEADKVTLPVKPFSARAVMRPMPMLTFTIVILSCGTASRWSRGAVTA